MTIQDSESSRPVCRSMSLRFDPPWLVAELGRTRRVLSFAPHLPGFQHARHIMIRQVRDADLGPGFDAPLWLASELAGIGHGDAPAMMTSRGLRHHCVASFGPACCLATVGLGNAERVGHRRRVPPAGYGTINIVLLIDSGLTEAAQIEALTIATQARTAAVIKAGVTLPTGIATGTGTDCIAVACDPGDAQFAGTHTELGEAVGRATYQAVLAGALDWIGQNGRVPPARPAG